MPKKNRNNGYKWRFFRAGGFDQVKLESGQDLRELGNLDQKLWVALACPVDNIHFDPKTLALIDTDKDRRIRASELISAVNWVVSMLNNPDDLIGENRTLTIDQINRNSEEGRKLYDSAKNALVTLGKKESDPVSVADIESLGQELSKNAFNGDGIITDDSSEEETVKKIINLIIETTGAVDDRSGKPGVDADKVESFFNLTEKYLAWASEPENDKSILVLGEETSGAADAVVAVKEKIEDYFARCAVAVFDERAKAALNGGEKPFEQISSRDSLSVHCEEISKLPIALIEPRKPLSLVDNINPAWADALKTFKTQAVDKMLGAKEEITEAEWRQILEKLAPYFSWQSRKPANVFDAGKAAEIPDSSLKEKLLTLIEKDKALEPVFDSLSSLEKLVRYHRDIYSLCNNFINFRELYSKKGSAIFMAGTLFLDQRTCRLCIKIDDMNKHSAMAAMAGTYLVYCECIRRGGAEKMNIVAAFTNGDSENLMPGRNGVFYDRNGNDWDATVVKIIENPISLKQAFWLPYKSFVKMIETQVAKRAMAAEAQSSDKIAKSAEITAMADKSKIPSQPPKKLDIGIVAAIGVAAGAIGTFLATVMGYVAGIIKMGPLAIIGAVIGLLLLISGPSLVLAYIKLRKRNLGPILDASGWAVNAKALINVPFGTALTSIASLPPGSHRDLSDPFAQKKSPWPNLLVLVLLLYLAYAALNHLGFINEWSGGRIGTKKAVPTVTETASEKN
ncbi:MAG TPA: hypothetical protein PLE24_00930 [Chitinispirillaceae bacterium]|jgi:hypothetical protein|nr:hypothetical protein [Chitinispirillaceae bacterium]